MSFPYRLRMIDVALCMYSSGNACNLYFGAAPFELIASPMSLDWKKYWKSAVNITCLRTQRRTRDILNVNKFLPTEFSIVFQQNKLARSNAMAW